MQCGVDSLFIWPLSSARRAPVIVIYHDVTDVSNPLSARLGIATRPAIFRQHVTYFARNFDLIGVADLLDGPLPRRPLLITFDDAYRSVLDIAGPILRDVDAPSLCFLIAGALRGDVVPIDNVLSLAVETFGLPRLLSLIGADDPSLDSVGSILSNLLPALQSDQIGALKRRIFEELDTNETVVRREASIFLDAGDLRRFAAYRIAVGSHSMTHSYFRSLSLPGLDLEIRQSRIELQRWSGEPVDCLSIPFGDAHDATHSALATARESGYRAVFLVGARRNRQHGTDGLYHRVSLRNETLARMPLTLRVLPALRSIRDAVGGP